MTVRINMARQQLIATGHANAPKNEDGRDLVCCAVSTLVQTLIMSCQALPGVIVYHDVAPGDVLVRVSAPESQTDAVAHRLQMTADGLERMAAQYPMCLELIKN